MKGKLFLIYGENFGSMIALFLGESRLSHRLYFIAESSMVICFDDDKRV
jgi:hypothetical protein